MVADTLQTDLRSSFRSIIRAPGLALLVITTLGLAMAANIGVFSPETRRHAAGGVASFLCDFYTPAWCARPGEDRRVDGHARSTETPGSSFFRTAEYVLSYARRRYPQHNAEAIPGAAGHAIFGIPPAGLERASQQAAD